MNVCVCVCLLCVCVFARVRTTKTTSVLYILYICIMYMYINTHTYASAPVYTCLPVYLPSVRVRLSGLRHTNICHSCLSASRRRIIDGVRLKNQTSYAGMNYTNVYLCLNRFRFCSSYRRFDDNVLLFSYEADIYLSPQE